METLGSPLVDIASLPDFAAWHGGVNPGYTLAQHAYPTVQPDQFFAVGSLLWPKLVRHESGLFLADGFSIPGFDQWFAKTSPSVPMKVRHQTPGNLDLRARKDNHAHAHAPAIDRCRGGRCHERRP